MSFSFDRMRNAQKVLCQVFDNDKFLQNIITSCYDDLSIPEVQVFMNKSTRDLNVNCLVLRRSLRSNLKNIFLNHYAI